MSKYLVPLSSKSKTMLIVQICFAITYLSWLILQPILQESMERKSTILFHETLIGLTISDEQNYKTLFNRTYFETLPDEIREEILASYKEILKKNNWSLTKKLTSISLNLFSETSLFVFIWLIASILLCSLVILEMRGAKELLFLLPLFVIFAATFNPIKIKPYSSLFPDEKILREHYLYENEKNNFFEGPRQLKKAWENYFIIEWAHENPSFNATDFEKQLLKGMYEFNLARWNEWRKGIIRSLSFSLKIAPSGYQWLLFFLWNFYLAIFINDIRIIFWKKQCKKYITSQLE